MATDLSDLSEVEPGATDPVFQGDDEIRKTRLHVKNWAGIEHALTGEHKFPVGADSGRPAPGGTSGRLYVNTENDRLERVDAAGTAWTMVSAVANQPFIDLANVTLTGFAQSVASTTAFKGIGNENIFLLGVIEISSTGTTNRSLTLTAQINGVNFNSSPLVQDSTVLGGLTRAIPFFFRHATNTIVGAMTITLLAHLSSATGNVTVKDAVKGVVLGV